MAHALLPVALFASVLPVVDGVTYVTPDGARVSCGGLVRVGLDAGEASGALERKRRIRTLEGLEPDLSSVFEHAGHQVSEASDAVAQARSAEAEVAGDIARIEGEKRSLLSEIGRLEQSYNQSQSERKQVERAAVRNHKIRTDTGIEISFPAEMGSNSDYIEFVNEPNGLISIELKKISSIENR